MKNRAAKTLLVLVLLSGVSWAQPNAVLTPVPPAGAPGNWKPTLGSILKITQDFNTIGYNFQTNTSVSWAGVYNPPIGADSTSFTIDWAEPDVTIDSNWQVRVLLGGGTVTNMPAAIESLMPGGTLDGILTATTLCPADMNGDGILDSGDIQGFVANFTAGDLKADFNGDGILDNGDNGVFVDVFLAGCASPVVITGETSLAVEMDAGQLQRIYYPGGYLSGASPGLYGKTGDISPLTVAASTPEAHLLSFYGLHNAVAAQLESNVLSDAAPPAALIADVYSFDASMQIVDQLTGVLLTRISGGNGEPHLYVSELTEPFMFFENALGYTPIQVQPVSVIAGGEIKVIVR